MIDFVFIERIWNKSFGHEPVNGALLLLAVNPQTDVQITARVGARR